MWQGHVACVLSFIGVHKYELHIWGERGYTGFGGETRGKETTWETQV